MNNVNRIIAVVSRALNSTPNGVSFFAINGYINSVGEKANYTINIGAKYSNAKKKDIEYVKNLDVSTLDTDMDIELLEKARVQLLSSLENPNARQSQAQADAYTKINDAVKIHNESGAIMIYGMKVSKNILVEGTYSETKSRPLTIAKNIIRKGMKTTKYRQYKVEVQPEDVSYSGANETIIVEVV
jgi:hypothetical protein